MVSEGRGRIFRRKDGKYLLYLPVDLATDSMFPFRDFKKSEKGSDYVDVKVSFKVGSSATLLIEKWQQEQG